MAVSVFKFHYDSINSRLSGTSPELCQLNLNSIMILLILCKIQHLSQVYLHLNSIMILLIPSSLAVTSTTTLLI